MAGYTVFASPDRLAEAKRLRAAYEKLPRSVYDGSHVDDVASFKAAVAAGCERSRLRNEMRRLVARRLELGMAIGGQVTAERLRRHKLKFDDRPKLRRQRRSSAQLTTQVLELHGRGLVVAAIADTLNVSDRRVREIVAATNGNKQSNKGGSLAKPQDSWLNQTVCEPLFPPDDIRVALPA